jgi:hypothetical protein
MKYVKQRMTMRSANARYSAEAVDFGTPSNLPCTPPDGDPWQAVNRPDPRITRRLAWADRSNRANQGSTHRPTGEVGANVRRH